MKILFVCLGNICRSPAAEASFKALVQSRLVAKDFVIDSAGTSGCHVGEMADERMRAHGHKRGLVLDSISRQFQSSDFKYYDKIIVMDDSNMNNVKALDSDNIYGHKIFKFTDFCLKHSSFDHVPDPYYGGAKGFDTVLDIVEDASLGLLERIYAER